MPKPEQELFRQHEYLGRVVLLGNQLSVVLVENFSNDNRRSPGRKPTQASLGLACFILGLDYFTYKLQASMMPLARRAGMDTQDIEAANNHPMSWMITMKGGGLEGKPESEVSLKSFIEEQTGSKRDSLSSPEKLASYVNFFGDVIEVRKMSERYTGAVGIIYPQSSIFLINGPHMFANLQAMGLAMISVHPGGVDDQLFRDVSNLQIKNAGLKEGKNFLQRMQLFRLYLRNELLNQKSRNVLIEELTKALGNREGERRLTTLDVIFGLQTEEEIKEMQKKFQQFAEDGLNPDFNLALNEGIEEYLSRRLHL